MLRLVLELGKEVERGLVQLGVLCPCIKLFTNRLFLFEDIELGHLLREIRCLSGINRNLLVVLHHELLLVGQILHIVLDEVSDFFLRLLFLPMLLSFVPLACLCFRHLRLLHLRTCLFSSLSHLRLRLGLVVDWL